MKYFTYILRNARRNPIRTFLTIASTSICLFLMMILLAFFDMREDAGKANRVFNRIITMNSNGFAGMLPIGRVPGSLPDGRRDRGFPLWLVWRQVP